MTSAGVGQPSPSRDNLVEVGAVAGAHGRDGRIRVLPSAGDAARFRRGARLYIAGSAYEVERAQSAAGPQLLLKLAGVDDRRQALALRGAMIEVPESDLPPPPPGAYYHYQLIDMTVVDESGAELGALTEIVPAGGANDVYVVTAEGRELLLPAVSGVIVNVDVAAKRMTVAPPEGLEWRVLSPPRRNRRPRRR